MTDSINKNSVTKLNVHRFVYLKYWYNDLLQVELNDETTPNCKEQENYQRLALKLE